MKRSESLQRCAVIAAVLVLPVFTGCGNFFPPINGGGGSGGGGTTLNRVYVANQAANSIGGFAIGTGTLAAVTNSPLATSYKPLSMVVTPNNSLLYVGSATGGIFVYFINSDGSLRAPTTGSQPTGVSAPAMAVSPDGQWLIALDGKTQLRVPAGTQHGKSFRFRGLGVPQLRSNQRGNFYVVAKIVVPQKLTARQHELFQEIAREFGQETDDEKGFFEKIKEKLG
jgi:DNA-binding beta-propeller fold protein YncE